MSATANPIVARIDALERAIASLQAQQSGGEALQSTFTTLLPTGVVGAFFPGGLQIPEVAGNPVLAPASSAVTWIRSSGDVIAQMFVEDNGGPNDVVVIQTNLSAIPGDTATRREVDINVQSPDTHNRLLITAFAENNGGLAGEGLSVSAGPSGNEKTAIVIKGDGSSSFLQLPSTQQLVLSIVSSSFNGNGTNSVAVTVNHSLGRSPTFAWVMPQGAPFTAWGFTFSTTQVSFTASDPFGVFANGTPYNFSVAILG